MSAVDVLPIGDQHDARWELWKADNRVSERRRVERVRYLAGAVVFALVVWLVTMAG